MRECKVKGLPDDDDLVAVDLVLARIRDKGTNNRNVYKTKVRPRLSFIIYCVPLTSYHKVKESMEPKSPIRNVATLSHKLLKNTNVKATVQFYQRVALIVSARSCSPDVFPPLIFLYIALVPQAIPDYRGRKLLAESG